MEAEAGAYRYAGGGGGSGFVWTSETASNVPSGYTVGTQYYLTDAATYAGNTSFTSTSGGTETGHSGDGYARITLISASVPNYQWIDIQTQKENGTLKGEFTYNGYTITVGNKNYTSTGINTAPILTAYDDKSGKTTTQFTIAMSATDENEGDTLTYTLKASTSQDGTYYTIGTVTGTSGKTKTIPVTAINDTSLSEYTQYWWKVEVTDGNGGTDETSGNLRTYCSGERIANASYEENYVTCGDCNGSGYACGGETTLEVSDPTACSNCGAEMYFYRDYCSACSWEYVSGRCADCGESWESENTIHDECDSCSGSGRTSEYCYYCSTCGYSDYNTSSHTCKCAHGQSEQHDS